MVALPHTPPRHSAARHGRCSPSEENAWEGVSNEEFEETQAMTVLRRDRHLYDIL
ncbi:hypothetical protein Scep_016791 [Stephania cephalantha]|uniref:Uncharacterized protein n=1 Tax=Stephania cephalantha TaxID=152367 RepID=A0AAP0IPM3_9MAGN